MIFVPPKTDQEPKRIKVSAIIFPEYDPETDLEFNRVDNLEVLNRFIQESWIASEEEKVSRFLDWFFELPCYTLKYSNNRKAIDVLKSLVF